MSQRDLFKALAEMFDREKAEYAVIGAFALYAYGYMRATRDIDFAVRIEFRERAINYLERKLRAGTMKVDLPQGGD